ncbi:polycystic kidney disease protein 1-like 2 [Mizuhopecten yessoensis]|uniref:polycystic kidney disease protein 1-like 2 n=1 Tax=Mizuhopecten yessoensis TaxID=6573 RepID=UPI000B45AC7D|nr:polycystic kidney disease protein 1-like 2 [Mizuhopecten yessoensis]
MIIQPVPGLISGSFMPFYTPDDASRCFYHEFIYRKLGDYVCIFIDQEDPEKVRQYDVFVRNGEYPTHLTYDQSTYLVADRDWMSCIAPQHFSEIGITYVGLRPIPIPGMGPYQWTPLNGPYLGDSYNISDPTLNPYNLTITTAGCMTWDKTKESWGGNKCLMDWYPPKYEVECTCNTEKDLTFGNTFFVPPNTIDFSTAFLKFSPQDQAAVLSLLILILLSYIILMIWARHQDKKDIVKWGVTPLMDNNIDDTYYYMVTVYTGMRRDAGTTSRIGFVVSGSEADTGIRELYDGVRRDMGTATVNNFLMTTPHPLGEIDYIYIWHDNSGEGSKASWYLNRVDIEDIQDKQKYFFLCGKWLCMDSADDNIDAVLPVCGKENVTTFENMFFMNTKENLAENHIWVSIFFRPTSSHFTRCQRVTCLMVFIMMSMIANAIYFTPADEFENPSLVRVGPLKFSLQSVYVSVISALISTPSVFLIVLMFRKSKPRTINQNLQDPSLKYAIPAIDSIAEKMLTESKELEKILVAKGIIKADGTILPFWCAYIAWFLSIAGSAVVMFFLMLYSMEWGKQKSEMWLTQFVLSFFEASAILDPVKVVLMAAFFAFIFTQLDKFKPSSLDRGLILRNYRQRFSCPTDIKMPARFFTPETIQEARKERQREMMMARALKECFLTIIFLWIIYSISFSNRDDRSYRVHDIISKHFVYPLDKRPTFPAITTTANYIDWLKLTAFPALFPEYEYNGEKMHWRWRQYYADLTNFRVGPPRLRQVRVVQDEEEYPFFGKIKTYPEYSFTNEELDDYCLHWKPLPCDVEKEAYSFSYNGWKHTSASSIWGIPVTGYYSTYSGGGYITELDVNWDFSNRTLEELNRLFWFDRQTRAVFLEFTLYSANLNLFTYVMLMAEFPETGGVTTMYTIYPLRIYQHHGNTGVYMIFCEVMFLVFLLGMILKIIYSMVKTKGNFFANAWNVVDFVCVVGGCIGVAMYFGRLILANETMGNFTEDPKNFVNFQHLAFWDLIFVTVLACLVFLSTIRVVGVLGYDKRIGEVFRVVDNCARDLFWFGVMFFYIFMGYCILGYLVFGRNIKAYWNIFDTMGTLFISMIGKSKFTELNEQDPLMAQLYFFTYILLIVYVLLTMFLAILCDSIAVVHAQTKNDRSEELIAFMIEQLKKFFSSSKKKREAQKLKSESGLGKQKPIELLSDLRLNLNDIMKTLPEKERNPFMK